MIIRHDVDNQKYIAFGKNGDFQSLAIFEDGNGTLIHPQWILTAAHIADDQQPGSLVTIEGQTYKVSEVKMYPQFSTNDLFEKRDIALVKLDRKVEGTTPVKFAKNYPPLGTKLYLAGNGDTGNGNSGPTKKDHLVRAGTNTLDSLTERFISFEFNSLVSGKATDLEISPGPGDSGGPAYMKVNGELIVVGVSSFEMADSRAKEGHYGNRNFYSNVSYYADWITETINGNTYYKTKIEGKDVVVIRKSATNGSTNNLTVNGKKATVDEIIRYSEVVEEELSAIEHDKINNGQNKPDTNDSQIKFFRYVEELAQNEAGIYDVRKAGGFMLNKNEFIIGNQTMSDEARQKALKKYDELFGQPLGNQQINARTNK
jgi:hypothetical protein